MLSKKSESLDKERLDEVAEAIVSQQNLLRKLSDKCSKVIV